MLSDSSPGNLGVFSATNLAMFPQFTHKYAWGLIADLCKKQGELPGVFRSNRRYVLPSELRIIVNALNQ